VKIDHEIEKERPLMVSIGLSSTTVPIMQYCLSLHCILKFELQEMKNKPKQYHIQFSVVLPDAYQLCMIYIVLDDLGLAMDGDIGYNRGKKSYVFHKNCADCKEIAVGWI
jgi:hypothetical protein